MSGSKGPMLGLIGVLVCCLIAALCGCQQSETVQPEVVPEEEPAAGAEITVGPADAPVKVVAFYPLNEGHQFIADYLKEFAEAHPGQVRLEVVDFRTPDGMKRWQETGLGCAGVCVNGETRHEITRDGETETVDLLKRMGSFWTKEDFEAVVYQILEQPEEASEPT